jgi:outer membrane protein TolC
VTEALASRYELVQARIDLKNRNLTKTSARNALLPTVDFVASYGGAGLNGTRNPLCPVGSGLGCGPGTGGGGGGGTGGGAPPFVGDYGDAFYSAFGKDYPSYSVGLNVNIPIRNRAAQADQVRSELELRQAQARLQQLENQVKIEVRNAQFSLEQSRARVETAQAGVELARQTLDAEQDKLSVGASTPFLLLQAQRDLVQAESNLVAGTTAYQKARVEFERAMGRTLKANNISVADAETGHVSQMPAMQGAQPREQK